MVRHVIAPVDELPPGTRKFLTIDERPIAIFNIKGEFFGLLNRCPHQGAALCEGPLIGLAQSSDPGAIEYTRAGEIIRCPWHGWEFDIRTGQSYCDPKRFRAQAYPVNVEPGAALVRSSIRMNAVSMPVRSASASAGSRCHFAASSPAGPTRSPMPPSVPSTTGRSHHA